MEKTYIIIEVANCHGGNFNYLQSLIDEFSCFNNGFGIKFQPFNADEIATQDYEWYKVYKELYFSPSQWQKIINQASLTKDIWLDIFDPYSIRILQENILKVVGIKLQASVLYNNNILNLLENIDLSSHKLIVNISGYQLEEIKQIVDRINGQLKPEELIIQIGFQGYPSEYIDSGLIKTPILKEWLQYKICFADHVAATKDEAIILPIVAVAKGCNFIEKHVLYSEKETKYDYFSALNKTQFQIMVNQIDLLNSAQSSTFIPKKEKEYLDNSIQIPILSKKLNIGSIPSLNTDFSFKRTNQNGLSVTDIQDLLKTKHILAVPKKTMSTLEKQDFKKAIIGTLIACRMKSSRLPKKALLKIGDLTSIETCIKSCLSFKNVNYTVLATSTHPDDAVLENYTYSKQVKFYQGDEEDVIQRYIDIADDLSLDIIIRVTGDCPFISNEIQELLLNRHFLTGADFTRCENSAIGTAVEIINVNCLKIIKNLCPTTEYSEYMTYYFINNPDYFKINNVELPSNLLRDYRLTLDYDEDLKLFNKIYEFLKKEKLKITLKNIFNYLDSNPKVAEINKSCTVKYKTDPALIALLKEKTKFHT
jgi:N,N'-diacetyllegionaminate synthase